MLSLFNLTYSFQDISQIWIPIQTNMSLKGIHIHICMQANNNIDLAKDLSSNLYNNIDIYTDLQSGGRKWILSI